MYQKYHTEAIVLAAYESGEADKTIILYTRDFGRVSARASAVRSEMSKMRYALQVYSLANVSLVKGRRGWRAAGASAIETALNKDVKAVAAFARISALLLRLVAGEEENKYLFEAVAQAHHALLSETCDAVPAIELVAVARILYALGYLSAEALQSTLFTHTAYGDPELSEAERLKDDLLLSINRAIAETQL
jgi:DNA repair protein RecO